jgi:hypothetical protein
MQSTIKLVAMLGLVGVLAAPVSSRAYADDSASQQATDVDQSSRDAASAPSDETAKSDSSQGFDTPNSDPAPSSDGQK